MHTAARTAAILALAGSTSAFAPTMGMMGTQRRQAVVEAAAVAISLPLAANAVVRMHHHHGIGKLSAQDFGGKGAAEPAVEVSDSRSTGLGDTDDEVQRIKVAMGSPTDHVFDDAPVYHNPEDTRQAQGQLRRRGQFHLG
jgi:hypothetical protein